MRVWQPGSHLMRERGAEVDDWSWRATVRRVSTLAGLVVLLLAARRFARRSPAAVPVRFGRPMRSWCGVATKGSVRC